MSYLCICGPGRSGTSVLVTLFGAWGFRVDEGGFDSEAQAGFETRVGSRTDLDVYKDPWLYEYLHMLPPETVNNIELLLVPIRDINDAATSRSVQERIRRLKSGETDEWKWSSWGTTAGGAIAPTTTASIKNELESGLWRLCQSAAEMNLEVRFISFPAFTSDFEYLWRRIGDILSDKISKEDALEKWTRIVDQSKVSKFTPDSSLTIEELSQIIENLRRDIYKLERMPFRKLLKRKLLRTADSRLREKWRKLKS